MSKVFYDKPIIEQLFEEFDKDMDSQDVGKLINLVNRLPSKDVNNKNIDGHTLLMLASSRGYTEIVELLLEKEDINIDICSPIYGVPALRIADAYKNTEIVKLLKNHQKN